jgi:hypothetical protein
MAEWLLCLAVLGATDKTISCWHEIPLWAGEEELHFICEIPKETSAKMEVATVSKSREKMAALCRLRQGQQQQQQIRKSCRFVLVERQWLPQLSRRYLVTAASGICCSEHELAVEISLIIHMLKGRYLADGTLL